ncbi:hypothetical protein AURDEDRAFT_181770 [Auricularia subglabra TFB-10046 SS5]|nr:hypothetical protein AURDEDRAFT_181770 [Auricularia subglabra TFB-10046 SS5]
MTSAKSPTCGDKGATHGNKGPSGHSASQIAKCPAKFDVWAGHQACTLAALSDLPGTMQADVRGIFDVSGRISMAYVTKGKEEYERLKGSKSGMLRFLKQAYEQNRSLFSDTAPVDKLLFDDLVCVLAASGRLEKMQKSSQKWTEADYAGQVYNLIRSPPVRKSHLSLQLPISLPQPPIPASSAEHKKIMAPRNVIPDASVFVSSAGLATLSGKMDSAFNRLKNAAPRGKFRHQATLASTLPDREVFEFASSVWEDKKPDQTHVDNAWRQNRMATAAAARQYHAFQVDAPVIGLVWAEGKVRAHIDWAGEENGHVSVYSAPYPAQESSELNRESGVSGVSTVISAVSAVSAAPDFQIWDLSQPAAAIAVHLLVRNIDVWTKDTFCKRVVAGVEAVARRAQEDKQFKLAVWKRGEVATKSPKSENSRVKKESIEGDSLNLKPAAPATQRRSGLRPRK